RSSTASNHCGGIPADGLGRISVMPLVKCASDSLTGGASRKKSCSASLSNSSTHVFSQSCAAIRCGDRSLPCQRNVSAVAVCENVARSSDGSDGADPPV